jgi:hypothetical protein
VGYWLLALRGCEGLWEDYKMQRIERYNDTNLKDLDREVHDEGWSVRHMVVWPGSHELRPTLIVVLEKPELPELPRDWRADWA